MTQNSYSFYLLNLMMWYYPLYNRPTLFSCALYCINKYQPPPLGASKQVCQVFVTKSAQIMAIQS